MSVRLGFVTSSNKKVSEVQATMGADFELVKLTTDIDELQPDNILDPTNLIHAKLLKAQAKFPNEDHIIVEDTSFTVDALLGLPGLNIKQWLESPKYYFETEDFDPRLAPDNIYLMAKGVMPIGGLVAKATVYIGHAYCEDRTIFSGSVSGQLTGAGNEGWGFDRIFIPDGYEERMGDLDPAIKAQISHRAVAAKALKTHLENL